MIEHLKHLQLGMGDRFCNILRPLPGPIKRSMNSLFVVLQSKTPPKQQRSILSKGSLLFTVMTEDNAIWFILRFTDKNLHLNRIAWEILGIR